MWQVGCSQILIKELYEKQIVANCNMGISSNKDISNTQVFSFNAEESVFSILLLTLLLPLE